MRAMNTLLSFLLSFLQHLPSFLPAFLPDTEDNPAATRGYSLALGRLPKKLLAPNPQVLNVVLRCLSDASRVDARVGDAGDAETRRNAISSIVSISREVGIVNRKGAGNGELATNIVGLDEGNISMAFSSLLASLNDYNTDRRGDVGTATARMRNYTHVVPRFHAFVA